MNTRKEVEHVQTSPLPCVDAANSDTDRVPYTCSLSIDSIGVVNVTISEVGTTTFTVNGKPALTLTNLVESSAEDEEYVDIISGTYEVSGKVFPNIDAFSFGEDITFDGVPELKVLVISGAYQQSFRYYTYNPAKGIFEPVKGLPVLVDPDYDEDSRKVVSSSKGRGLGDIYSVSEYTWRSGGYELTMTETQNVLGDGPDYERVIQKMVRGTLTETSRKVIKEADVFGEAH
jgi:hypothetical protein